MAYDELDRALADKAAMHAELSNVVTLLRWAQRRNAALRRQVDDLTTQVDTWRAQAEWL